MMRKLRNLGFVVALLVIAPLFSVFYSSCGSNEMGIRKFLDFSGTPAPPMGNNAGDVGGDTGANGGGNDGGAGGDGTVSGTWSASGGLRLTDGVSSIDVPADANPSNATLTLRTLSQSDIPDDEFFQVAFQDGVELGPSGTTFSTPVTVRVELDTPTLYSKLPVIHYDEEAGAWEDAGIMAEVAEGGTLVSFQVDHFSSYGFLNPPPPPTGDTIGDGEIIAGTGGFSGFPFDPLPGVTDAYLTYSPFGDAFGLSLINVGVQSGASVASTAGLNATVVENRGGFVVGYVTFAGGLGGLSIFNDGTGLNKPVTGIMFLRKTGGQWIVQVYAVYEGGVIFGEASGSL